MRRALILAMAATAMAGCSGKGGKTAGAPGAGQAAGDGAVAGPMRKAGLWSITRVRDGKPSGGATKVCIDAATDAKVGALGGGLGKSLCTDQTSQRNADGSWSFSTTCRLGPAGVVTTRGMARGDFAARYTVHSESDIVGAQFASLNGHHVSDMSASYGGACPADMQPGDVILSDGMKLNPSKMSGAHVPGIGGDP